MTRQTFLRAVAAWLAILPLAILNGVLRDAVLLGHLEPNAARSASGIILCIAVLGVAALTAAWIGPLKARTRWRIGALWLVLTMGFETSFGLAQHHSWQELLAAYTFQGGDLWPLVLMTTFVAPWAGARLRGMA